MYGGWFFESLLKCVKQLFTIYFKKKSKKNRKNLRYIETFSYL